MHFIPGGENTPPAYLLKPLRRQYLKTAPITVIDARANGGVVLSSPISQPIGFQFATNEELPSSLTRRMGIAIMHQRPITHLNAQPMSVKYTMKFTTCSVVGSIIDEKVIDLDIRSVYFYPNPERPLKVYHTVVTASCCSSNVFSFYCATDRTVYGPGDRIRLSCWFNTKHSKNMPNITSVVAKLEVIATSVPEPLTGMFNIGGSVHISENRTALVNSPCAIPKLMEVSQVFIDVPASIVPDFNLAVPSHPLVIRNELSVSINVAGGSWGNRSFYLCVPVVFNSLPTSQLSMVPFPVRQKPLSSITAEAQQFYVSHPNPPSLAAAVPGIAPAGAAPMATAVGYTVVPSS